jgi:hypothetical protein
MPKYKVIPRMEHFEDGPWNAILFLPDAPSLPDNVMTYEKIGQHGEAARNYFSRTRAPHTVSEWQECIDLIEEERTLGPQADRYEAVIATRIS